MSLKITRDGVDYPLRSKCIYTIECPDCDGEFLVIVEPKYQQVAVEPELLYMTNRRPEYCPFCGEFLTTVTPGADVLVEQMTPQQWVGLHSKEG